DALAAYERQRNAAVMAMYDFTYATSALAPPTPQDERLFAAMRDDPVLAGRFFGVFAGTVAVQDFVAPLSMAA
ncbi:MAG TPA: hypothetical protein VF468_10635, partial [Actinomycetota bacterium]|nr:hypothetical protein [Actinomycetota bacterium]